MKKLPTIRLTDYTIDRDGKRYTFDGRHERQADEYNRYGHVALMHLAKKVVTRQGHVLKDIPSEEPLDLKGMAEEIERTNKEKLKALGIAEQSPLYDYPINKLK